MQCLGQKGLQYYLKRGTYFIMNYVLLSSYIRGISSHLGANTCRREIDKSNDSYTVSVMKGREIVDHVPCKLTHKISRIFWREFYWMKFCFLNICAIFLWEVVEVSSMCTVTGNSCYSCDFNFKILKQYMPVISHLFSIGRYQKN